jgi:hypothetical protein
VHSSPAPGPFHYARGHPGALTKAGLLVYLVELFLQLCDLLSQVPLERFIGNQQYELPILHDLHFQLYALVLVTHDSIPTSILGRRNRVFVQRYFVACRLARG